MRLGPWLEAKAPGLHRFLSRRDAPYPILRKGLAVTAVALVLFGGICLLAAPLSSHPVTVVRIADMMHCENGFQAHGSTCRGAFGRIGTLDPGDVAFVQHADAHDVETLAAGGGSHSGKSGDVLLYRPDGERSRALVLHRALFYLEVNADGTYTVADLGIDHEPTLDQDRLTALTGCVLGSTQESGQWSSDDSGFITRGDNNPLADQCEIMMPIREDWIVGRARGEIPWVGLVALAGSDALHGTKDFSDAPGDSKLLLLLMIGALVGGYAVNRRRNKNPRKANR